MKRFSIRSAMTQVVRTGLTLIELVVVLAILVAVAAMVLPRLDFLRDQADNATAAASSADLTTLLQTYKSSSGSPSSFPTLDLLIDESDAVYSKIWSEAGAPFTAWSIPAYTGAPGTAWYQSLSKGGLRTAYTQASTAADASDSTGTAAAIDLVTLAAGGDLTLAEVSTAGGHPYISSLVKASFPDTAAVPANVKLVALGIGARNSMAGNVMANVPLETQGDDSRNVYCRYIAIFAVYGSGKPAQLKAVVDHRMKQIGKRIDDYKGAGPTGT